MDEDLSLTTTGAGESSTPSSAPDPTGATVTAPSGPNGAPAPEGTPAPEAPAAPTDDPEAPPEGTNEVQAGRWKTLRESRDSWQDKATSAEEKLSPFEHTYDASLAFSGVVQRAQVSEADARELERIVYNANPPLWDAMVRRAHEQYGTQLGGAPAPQGAPPVVPPVVPSGATPGAAPDGFDDELAYLQASNPQLAAYVEHLQKTAGRVEAVEGKLNAFTERAEATDLERVESAHDAQMAPFIGQLFADQGVAKTVTVNGAEQLNPQLERMLNYLEQCVEADPVAGPALKASREAFRIGQHAAVPGLRAALKAEVGRVFAEQIAPMFTAAGASRAAAADVTAEAARRAAEAAKNPPPAPGGATPPAPGQGGKLPLQDRIRGYYAQQGQPR